jgi:hypothetical protein
MDVVDFVLLALKAATHHVLWMREVYPRHLFHSERVFDTYTQACRHPDVRAYVSSIVESLKERTLLRC